MRFITAGYRTQYNLNPTIGELMKDNGGIVRRDAHGLSISSDNTRILDTDAQAVRDGWSIEQKIKMERHLLSHPDFGHARLVDSGLERDGMLLNSTVWDLFLAPGEMIPEDTYTWNGEVTSHLELAKAQRWWKYEGDNITALVPTTEQISSDRICVFSRPWQGAAMRCSEPALEGEDYCEYHSKSPAEVGS
jgi:hypothetical protein